MSEKGEGLATAGGCAFMIVIMGYGLAQIWAGFIGIDHHLGSGWAWAAVAGSFILRFTLPITVGSFFGAMDVWGWHWAGALAFAAPGLAFMLLMIPGALASAFGKGRSQY
jgi:hypothetical protein